MDKTVGTPNVPTLPNVPRLQQGGRILQSGLAYLHQGEEVVRAAQVARGDAGGNVINNNFDFSRAILAQERQIERIVQRAVNRGLKEGTIHATA